MIFLFDFLLFLLTLHAEEDPRCNIYTHKIVAVCSPGNTSWQKVYAEVEVHLISHNCSQIEMQNVCISSFDRIKLPEMCFTVIETWRLIPGISNSSLVCVGC